MGIKGIVSTPSPAAPAAAPVYPRTITFSGPKSKRKLKVTSGKARLGKTGRR